MLKLLLLLLLAMTVIIPQAKCENCGKEEDSSSKILKDTSPFLFFCNQQCQRGAWTKHKKKYIDMGAQSLIRAIRDGDTVKVELIHVKNGLHLKRTS